MFLTLPFLITVSAVVVFQPSPRLLGGLVIVLSICVWLSKQSSDPYGLFHLSLNKLDGEDVPHTEWLNMGYWRVRFRIQARLSSLIVHQDASTFPEACQGT
jgi:hypothetical protein